MQRSTMRGAPVYSSFFMQIIVAWFFLYQPLCNLRFPVVDVIASITAAVFTDVFEFSVKVVLSCKNNVNGFIVTRFVKPVGLRRTGRNILDQLNTVRHYKSTVQTFQRSNKIYINNTKKLATTISVSLLMSSNVAKNINQQFT